jgi:hypothetical protein
MGDMRRRICFLFREKAEQFVKREKTGKFIDLTLIKMKDELIEVVRFFFYKVVRDFKLVFMVS